jgi:ESCRT-II complex subunit VPS36
VFFRFFFFVFSPQVTDEMICRTIMRHFPSKDYVTPLVIAQLESVSITLAEEYLSIVELHGDICRDESPEGLRFYPNRFLASP